MLTEKQKEKKRKIREKEKAIERKKQKQKKAKERVEKKEKIRVKRMLQLRAKGYTLDAIAGIFHIKNRERIRQLIRKYKNDVEFQDLYRRIAEFKNFIKRNGDIE